MHEHSATRATNTRSLLRRYAGQVVGTAAVAMLLVFAFSNLKTEPTGAPTGEQSSVPGIAAVDLQRDLATPTPVALPAPEKPTAAPEPVRPRRAAADRPQPAAPAAPAPSPTVEPEPGPPLALTPPPQEPDSFVTAAGRTSVAVLKTSANFVTTTVPNAVVTTTKDALGKAKSFGAAVLDRITP
jgi:hypothetical protein